MYFVYLLYSEKCNRYYIGYAADINTRLLRHNNGYITATKNCRPYKLIATKLFLTETEARKEEARIKKQKTADPQIRTPNISDFSNLINLSTLQQINNITQLIYFLPQRIPTFRDCLYKG